MNLSHSCEERTLENGVSRHATDILVCFHLQTFVHAAAFFKEGTVPTSDAARYQLMWSRFQLRIVDLGGCGGLEDWSCKPETYLPFARFAPA